MVSSASALANHLSHLKRSESAPPGYFRMLVQIQFAVSRDLLYYSYVTPMLLLCYPYVTPMLLLCYPYVTPMLPLCYSSMARDYSSRGYVTTSLLVLCYY